MNKAILFIDTAAISIKPSACECKRLSIRSKIVHNEYFKTVLTIVLIVVVIFGFFFSLQFILNVDVPVRVVESGSMCVPYGGGCGGWSDIFEPTLHVGDIIVIQGVNPEDINANYPYSDIIVYQKPTNPSDTPIVHRVVEKYQVNGVWYFQTKGDGNCVKWPNAVSSGDYDSNYIWHTGEGVCEDLVLGIVVMRIPWFGHFTLFMHDNIWVLPVFIGVVIAIFLLELFLPVVKSKRKQPEIEIEKEGFEI